MNYALLTLWGTVIFGVLTVLLGAIWFMTGRSNMMLQRLFGISALMSAACFGYGRFVLGAFS
jgi:hypothetical protein